MKNRQEVNTSIIAKAWKDEAYKQELLSNPKAIIEQESGLEFPEEVDMQVLEEDSTSLYFVLPMNPKVFAELSQEQIEDLSEEELEAIAGGKYGPLAKAAMSIGSGALAMTGWFLGSWKPKR